MGQGRIAPDAFREARIRAGLSQSELAEKVGVAQPTVSTWESGAAYPRPQALTALRGILALGAADEDSDEGMTESPSSSPFGEWLIRTRTSLGMSRRELAERSGVTEPQIWNIETGNTLNPQARTRERLSGALGEVAPSEVVELTEDDAEIPDVGTLTDFDPHRDEDLPEEPGVYVFYDVSDRPVYVGKSENIRRRIREHSDKFWFKAPIVETAAFVRIGDEKLRGQVEQTLIRFLKSNAVINRQHVRR